MRIERFEDSFDDAAGWNRDGGDLADAPPDKAFDEGPDDPAPEEPRIAAVHVEPSVETPESVLAGHRASREVSLPFIKGPLCREWIIQASRLRKPALIVGLSLWFKAGVVKDDFIRGKRAESKPIRVDRGLKKRFQISPWQLSRGIHALEIAGLIVITKGGAGRCPWVAIVNIQIPRNASKRARK
jgi:hypothetical protein